MARSIADPTAESRASLWRLIASPAIWAGHFLACYVTSGIVCARYPEDAPALQLTLFAYTAAALAGIGWSACKAFRYRRHGSVAGDGDSDEARHRFLGQAGVLLAGLSLIATLYVAVAAIYVGVCR